MSLKKFAFVVFIQWVSVLLIGQEIHFFKPSNPYFEYTGRIDFTDPDKPRFWSSGVYIAAKFQGTSCKIILNDEVLYGSYHNYIELIVDHEKPIQLKTKGKTNTVDVGSLVANKLSDESHSLLICKNTEDGIGYLEFAGLGCQKLLPARPKPARKIECIGNSITCG